MKARSACLLTKAHSFALWLEYRLGGSVNHTSFMGLKGCDMTQDIVVVIYRAFHGRATLYRNRNKKSGMVSTSISKEKWSKLEIENKETFIFESDSEGIRLVPARTVNLFKNKG